MDKIFFAFLPVYVNEVIAITRKNDNIIFAFFYQDNARKILNQISSKRLCQKLLLTIFGFAYSISGFLPSLHFFSFVEGFMTSQPCVELSFRLKSTLLSGSPDCLLPPKGQANEVNTPHFGIFLTLPMAGKIFLKIGQRIITWKIMIHDSNQHIDLL